MKNLLMAFIVLGSASAFAEGNVSKPCQQIKSACEAAGFKRGEHKEKQGILKGLYKDCMSPILEGKSVAGVTVGADVVAACKEKKEARHKSK